MEEFEYCPFQKICGYSEDINKLEGVLTKNLDRGYFKYTCKAFESFNQSDEKSECSYLNNLNRVLEINEKLEHMIELDTE